MFIIYILTTCREGLQLFCSNLDVFKIRVRFTELYTKFETMLKSPISLSPNKFYYDMIVVF